MGARFPTENDYFEETTTPPILGVTSKPDTDNGLTWKDLIPVLTTLITLSGVFISSWLNYYFQQKSNRPRVMMKCLGDLPSMPSHYPRDSLMENRLKKRVMDLLHPEGVGTFNQFFHKFSCDLSHEAVAKGLLIYGGGGSGKTLVAAQIVHNKRFWSEAKLGLLIGFDMMRYNNDENEFFEAVSKILICDLGVNDLDKTHVYGHESIAKSMNRYISTNIGIREVYNKTLIVFSNVPNASTILMIDKLMRVLNETECIIISNQLLLAEGELMTYVSNAPMKIETFSQSIIGKMLGENLPQLSRNQRHKLAKKCEGVPYLASVMIAALSRVNPRGFEERYNKIVECPASRKDLSKLIVELLQLDSDLAIVLSWFFMYGKGKPLSVAFLSNLLGKPADTISAQCSKLQNFGLLEATVPKHNSTFPSPFFTVNDSYYVDFVSSLEESIRHYRYKLLANHADLIGVDSPIYLLISKGESIGELRKFIRIIETSSAGKDLLLKILRRQYGPNLESPLHILLTNFHKNRSFMSIACQLLDHLIKFNATSIDSILSLKESKHGKTVQDLINELIWTDSQTPWNANIFLSSAAHDRNNLFAYLYKRIKSNPDTSKKDPSKILDCTGKNALHAACTLGNHELVSICSKPNSSYKFDVNSKTRDNETPLMLACRKNRATTCKKLLDWNGIDVKAKNNNGETAFEVVAKQGDVRLVRLMFDIQSGLDITSEFEDAVFWTMSWGNLKSFKELDRKCQNRSPKLKAIIAVMQCFCPDVSVADMQFVREEVPKQNQSDEYVAQMERIYKVLSQMYKPNGLNAVDYFPNFSHQTAYLLSTIIDCNSNNVNLQNLLEFTLEQKAFMMWTAVHFNQPDVVKHLIEIGVPVDVRAKDSVTSLMIACKAGYTELVKLLIERNSDVEAEDDRHLRPMHYAALPRGNGNIIRALATWPEKSFETKRTKRCGFIECPNHLVTEKSCAKTRANVNAATPRGTTPLMTAARSGNAGVIEELMQLDADATARKKFGHTALFLTAKFGWQDCIDKLLKNHQVDVDVRNDKGMTPLLVASKFGYKEIMRMLLQSGADVNRTQNNGWTPLMKAAESGQIEAIKCLLKSPRIDVNAQQRDGWTALHIAYRRNYRNVIDQLLGDERIKQDIEDWDKKVAKEYEVPQQTIRNLATVAHINEFNFESLDRGIVQQRRTKSNNV